MANNPFALSFAPITNALAGIQKQRNTDREFEESGRRWEQQNWLAQGQFDLQKQAAARQAAEYDRQNTVRGEVTNWLAQNPNVGGVPQPIVDLARIQGDPSGVQNYIMAEAKRKAEMANREAPSNVREWQYFSKLPPEQQQQYLIMRRAQTWKDTGTEFVLPNPMNPSQPSATITKNNAGETQDKAIGKGAGERVSDTIARARAASGKLTQLVNLETRMKDLETGRLAPAKMTAGAWAKALGVSDDALRSMGIDPNQPGNVQAFNAISNRMMVDMIGSGGFPANNFSDADRDFLLSTVPRAANEPGANKLIIEAMRRTAQLDIQKAREWQTWSRRNPRANADDFEIEWSDRISRQDIFGDLRKRLDTLGMANPSGPERQAPAEAIQMLQANPTPQARAQFDEVFGPGASSRAMGGR